MNTEYYLTTLIEGINDDVNKTQLDVYLERKFKEISRKGIKRNEFIKGCVTALNKLDALYEEGLNDHLFPQYEALNRVIGKGDGTAEKQVLAQINHIKDKDPFIQLSGVNGFGLRKSLLEKLESAIHKFRGLHPEFILWGMADLIKGFDFAYETRLDYFLKQNSTLTEKEFKLDERRKAKELQQKYFYDETNNLHQKYFHLLKKWRRYLKDHKVNSLEETSSKSNDDQKRTYATKFATLAYVFEQHAFGSMPPNPGDKSKLEPIGQAYLANKDNVRGKSGNTFYDNYKDFNVKWLSTQSKDEIGKVFGDDWERIILEITDKKDEVEKYLKTR